MPRKVSHRRTLSVEPLERRLALHAGVNPSAVLVTNFGDIEFELLEDSAPGTVDNFLNYVKDGDYVNSIFHRLVPGFVLQGGGFNTTEEIFCPEVGCSLDVIDNTAFGVVPTDDPIVNEFAVPNTRGTVAMAKLGGDPDSATNQFFVNLDDNRGNLDNQNGGFTVFARVNDMTTVDRIAGLEQADISSIFDLTQPAALGAISQAPYEVSSEGFRWVQVQEVTGTSVVHGHVFNDTNGNGSQDTNESGRSGVTVFDDTNQNGVIDAGEVTGTSDADGNYHLIFEGDHTYNVAVAGWPTTNQPATSGSLEFGHSATGVNFGTLPTASTWHNSAVPENVDGLAGVLPLDALQVINEINERNISAESTGILPAASGTTFFPDTNDDGIVSPVDAIIVINRLNATSTPAAALSASAVAHSEDGDEDESSDGLDSSIIDNIFANL